MNHSKLQNHRIVSIATLPIGLFIFILILNSLFVMTGCANDEISIPEYSPPAPPPKEVAIEQLLFDYMTDEVAADIKYKDKRILLNEVEVEEVVSNYFAMRREFPHTSGYSYLYVEYFLSRGCKFTLEDFELMQNVQVGYILNLVGNCDGLSAGLIMIADCYAESVFGDLGTSVEGVY